MIKTGRVMCFLALTMAACAQPDLKEGKFTGTAIRLRSTAEICEHLQLARSLGQVDLITSDLAELAYRKVTSETPFSLALAPQPGLAAAEVLCLWGQPSSVTLKLDDDGTIIDVWRYKNPSRKLYFKDGTLLGSSGS